MVTRKFRFTNRSFDALPPCPADSASKANEYSDLEVTGLKVLVSKSREIVFYHRYVYGGRKRAIRIGGYPGITIQEARQQVQENKAKLDINIDPKDAADRIRGMPTFREHSRSYLKFVEGYKRSADADESKLRLYLNDHFGDRRLCDITTRDIQAYQMMISKKLSQSTANRHLALLSMMFNVAIQWDLLERSPTKGVKKFKEDNQKQRFLSPDEIGRLYQAMEAEGNKVAVNALKLLLLTGCRREEILQLKWEDVSLESGTIFLSDSKTGSRYVQLNAAAIELLKGIEHVGKFVFPGRRDSANKPLNNPRKCFTRVLKAAGIEHIRVHDLRHTHASILVNQGASLFVVQQALGHSNPIQVNATAICRTRPSATRRKPFQLSSAERARKPLTPRSPPEPRQQMCTPGNGRAHFFLATTHAPSKSTHLGKYRPTDQYQFGDTRPRTACKKTPIGRLDDFSTQQIAEIPANSAGHFGSTPADSRTRYQAGKHAR